MAQDGEFLASEEAEGLGLPAAIDWLMEINSHFLLLLLPDVLNESASPDCKYFSPFL